MIRLQLVTIHCLRSIEYPLEFVWDNVVGTVNILEFARKFQPDLDRFVYSVSGLSCPGAEAYLTVIFHSFLHNNNINSDYILGANIYFTPHGNFSSYF